MEYVVVDKEKLENDLTIVADSIRAKSGTTEDLAFPSGFKSVVDNIDTSKPEQEKTIYITENGKTEVIPDEGNVLSKVTVNVEVESGGDSHNNPWVTYETMEIEIGENNVTNAIEAEEYMKSVSGYDTINSFFILDNPTIYNQSVFRTENQSKVGANMYYRYRHGVITEVSLKDNFDAILVPNTKYLVCQMTVNISNVNPY